MRIYPKLPDRNLGAKVDFPDKMSSRSSLLGWATSWYAFGPKEKTSWQQVDIEVGSEPEQQRLAPCQKPTPVQHLTPVQNLTPVQHLTPVVIGVVGVTGSGKSSFIQRLTQRTDIEIGDGLDSGTNSQRLHGPVVLR